MKKAQKKIDGLSTPSRILIAALLLLGVTGVVQAVVLGGDDVIDAPELVADDAPGATNSTPQLFQERQGVTLPTDVRCTNRTNAADEAPSDTIAAGEVVNSYLIFHNTAVDGIGAPQTKTWTFDAEVVCVMAETSGLYQSLTDSMLGNPNTNYELGPLSGRGLERDGSDAYDINGNQLTVTMTPEEPGDWIRVLTKVGVPEDTTAPVVRCESGINPAGREQENNSNNKGDNDNFVSLIGADTVDGAVALYLYDTVSETEFGPYTAGANLQIVNAKGAQPKEVAIGKELDYRLSVQGSTLIRATDAAGNVGEAICTE